MTVNTAYSKFACSGDFYLPEESNFTILLEIFGPSFSVEPSIFYGINPLGLQ